MAIQIMKKFPEYQETTNGNLYWYDDNFYDGQLLCACLERAGVNPMNYDGKEWFVEAHMRLDLDELRSAIERFKDFPNQSEQFKSSVGQYFDEDKLAEIAKVCHWDEDCVNVPTIDDLIETLEEFLEYETYYGTVTINLY